MNPVIDFFTLPPAKPSPSALGLENTAVWIPLLILLALLCLATTKVHASDAIWEGVYKYQQKLAEHGNPEAQFKLGEMYEEGRGVARDFALARDWYAKAAAQGYQPAIDRLPQLDVRQQRVTQQERAAIERAERERQLRERTEREAELRRQEQARLEQERRERRVAAQRAAEQRDAQAQAEIERIEMERQRHEEEREARRHASEQAIKQAEEAWQKSLERRIAKERAQAEMIRMKAGPSAMEE